MGNNYYKRDSRDVHFVLNEHLQVEKLLSFEKYTLFSMEDFEMILEQAEKIALNRIAPTFQDTDREDPARFENGKVYAPKCFHPLWDLFREGSWFALTQSPDYGGQGLPLVIAEAATEFFMSANFTFGTYSGMGPGQGALIENFGNEKQKGLFCEKLYDGTWGGTMALTEPDVGSDAHMIGAKAVKDGDCYRVTGSKIFITSGDHDLTENIVHMVLARVEGAPDGAKGVSLFAVPKIWVNEDGSMGEPNDVTCVGIEHKMGLHGSATCQMSYGDNDACYGHLIGEEGMGLAYMFQMVNVARMAVGLESTAFAQNIYANALEYAKERVQGTRFGKKGDGRVRIIEHPEVRRLLMSIKSLAEGMRVLTYRGYFFEDIAHGSEEEEEARFAQESLDFFTPIIKGYCSLRIWDVTSMGIEILGGYGYTSEYPIEQYARDCKILSLWDGTTFIQSIDLVGRKLKMKEGRAYRAWIDEMRGFIDRACRVDDVTDSCSVLADGIDNLEAMVEKYGTLFGSEKQDLIPLTSTRFLECCGEVAVAHLLLEQALIALEKSKDLPEDHPDYCFYRGKVETANFFARNFLPNLYARRKSFELEDLSAVQIREEWM